MKNAQLQKKSQYLTIDKLKQTFQTTELTADDQDADEKKKKIFDFLNRSKTGGVNGSLNANAISSNDPNSTSNNNQNATLAASLGALANDEESEDPDFDPENQDNEQEDYDEDEEDEVDAQAWDDDENVVARPN